MQIQKINPCAKCGKIQILFYLLSYGNSKNSKLIFNRYFEFFTYTCFVKEKAKVDGLKDD
jgi:hypothetical protein